jgi:hypothetical protein
VRPPEGDAGDLQLPDDVHDGGLLLDREVEKPGLELSVPRTSTFMRSCSGWHMQSTA